MVFFRLLVVHEPLTYESHGSWKDQLQQYASLGKFLAPSS